MLLCGPAVERRQFGNQKHGGDDIKRARKIVGLLDVIDVQRFHRPTRNEIDAALAPYESKADRLVRVNLAWIRAVAKGLDQYVGLLTAEILALKPQEPAA
jgi:hypothetical protein